MEISLDKIEIFAEGLDHPEGLLCHPDGSIWTGGEAGQIYRISPNGNAIKEVANTGGFILGMALSPGADWIVICDLAKKCLWKLDIPSFQLNIYSENFGGHQFNIPNYPCFDSRGNLYVSESGGFRQVTGKIIKFDKEGIGQVWHKGPFNFANGIALDENERHIYTVCSFLPGVERIVINEDGSAGKREVFITLPESVPDGLAFDAEGNLYISCYAPNKVFKVKPDRSVSVLINDWEGHTLSNPTNLAFGGPAFDQLFTSNLGRWHISKIDLGTPGLKLACHQKK